MVVVAGAAVTALSLAHTLQQELPTPHYATDSYFPADGRTTPTAWIRGVLMRIVSLGRPFHEEVGATRLEDRSEKFHGT